MNTKILELLKLIQDNPTLEIMPMVATECVGGDDYSCWSAEWGRAEVDEYYNVDERIYFKSTDYDELVEDCLDRLDNEILKYSDEDFEGYGKHYVDNLEWTKAIVVHIDAR